MGLVPILSKLAFSTSFYFRDFSPGKCFLGKKNAAGLETAGRAGMDTNRYYTKI